MDDQENKPKKALFHGFPDEDNIQVKNVLDNLERTFLPIGSEIGRYRIIEEIDRGGMAVVYLARDLDRVLHETAPKARHVRFLTTLCFPTFRRVCEVGL